MNKAATLLNETIKPITAVAPAVCTENPIRIDWGRESPNVSIQ